MCQTVGKFKHIFDGIKYFIQNALNNPPIKLLNKSIIFTRE